mgnify:CR=1 FL=1
MKQEEYSPTDQELQEIAMLEAAHEVEQQRDWRKQKNKKSWE